jgi:CBS domain containing-hemolysin-like protein
VIDESGDILGIITVDDAMEILLPKDWRQRLATTVWLAKSRINP